MSEAIMGSTSWRSGVHAVLASSRVHVEPRNPTLPRAEQWHMNFVHASHNRDLNNVQEDFLSDVEKTRPAEAGGRRAELRERLIDAAERLIEKQGLAGVKARALAEDCRLRARRDLHGLSRSRCAHPRGERAHAGASRRASRSGPAARRPRRARLAKGPPRARRPRPRLSRLRLRAPGELARPVRAPPAGRQASSGMADRRPVPPFRKGRGAARSARAPHGRQRSARLSARSLFSAVHGLVLLGLEEKLAPMPLPTLRAEVARLVTATAKGLETMNR